jgi:hypothetical protein
MARAVGVFAKELFHAPQSELPSLAISTAILSCHTRGTECTYSQQKHIDTFTESGEEAKVD